jgi:hypothetical protein
LINSRAVRIITKKLYMEDEFEEKVLKQACFSQFKFFSKLFVLKSPNLGYFMKILRPEFFFLAIVFFLFVLYLQILFSSSTFQNYIASIFIKSKPINFSISKIIENDSWQLILNQSAAYSIQGRRMKMEDR